MVQAQTRIATMQCLQLSAPGLRGLRSSPAKGLRRARDSVAVQAAIRARWCLDIKYGDKLDAVALVQEWVRDIGSQAGLSPSAVRINSGSVGVPESRLELEVEFETLALLERFWASIPPQEHRAWSQRMQNLIVHGSPAWEVYRTCDVAGGLGAPSAAAASSSSSGGSLQMASAEELGQYGARAGPPSTARVTASGLSVVGSPEEADTILDWKGDPMKINPGDKLPFKFL